jgi:SET domain-containing protein
MLLVKTKLKESRLHGIGLFADQFIPKGTATWEYSPEYDTAFTKKQIDKLPTFVKNRLLDFLYFDKKLNKFVLCCDDQRFINHSSKKYNILSTPRKDTALEDIQKGEELVCNYNHYEAGYFERRQINELKLKKKK